MPIFVAAKFYLCDNIIDIKFVCGGNMVFSSIPFLFFFLPIVMVLYYITPMKFKNLILFIASLLFYAWGEPKNVIVMVLSIVVSYFAGFIIEKNAGTYKAKICLITSVIVQLSFLMYFKYTDFLMENINRLTGLEIPLLKITLPVGISFYTFQLISYTVDIYRGERAQKKFINMAAYIAMFPQLVAGPIVRYCDIRNELEKRNHSIEDISYGIRRFAIGLGKKVFLANQFAGLCDIFKASDEKSVLFYWLYAVSFSMYIYFDFSGYSDMAIGLGRMMGFHFNENFNYPYISKSITEFWRRWHISLGTWFRDYVYIPLGGNRVKVSRHYFNIFIVWMLTGFWHGAQWNFCLWGVYFAILLIIEKRFLSKYLNKHNNIAHIYTVILLIISFVIFNADSLYGLIGDIKGLLGIGVPLVSVEAFYYFKSYAFLLAAGLLGATPFVKNTASKVQEKYKNILEPIIILVILVLVTAFLVDGSFNPFLYFRF